MATAAETGTGTEHVDETEVAAAAVRCAACDAELTTPARAVQRSGAHEHTFRNPAGYSWRLACYRDAPGCTTVGTPTTQATWFSGHAWSYAECAACRRHVGWWFAGPTSFVGLIVTRILR